MDLVYRGNTMIQRAAVWKIDGIPINATPQTIAGQLLASVPDLQYRSIDALRDLFDNLLSLSIEMALIEKENKKGGERGALTRYINSVSKQKRFIPEDRIKLLISLYDHILQSEGLGLLRGFGFEDSAVGNAERTSNVIKLYANEKEDIMATKKKETGKVKRSELIAAAKELNIILEPDPEIEVGLPSEELMEILVEAAKLLEPGDKISVTTQKVLDNLSKRAFPVAEVSEAGEEPVAEPEKTEAGEVEITDKDISVEKEDPPEPVKEKAPAKKKDAPVKEKKAPTKEKATTGKDEFGFAIGTRPSLFAASLKEKPGTMKEICNRPWNKVETFYNVVKHLRELGVLEKDEKTKVLSIKTAK